MVRIPSSFVLSYGLQDYKITDYKDFFLINDPKYIKNKKKRKLRNKH